MNKLFLLFSGVYFIAMSACADLKTDEISNNCEDGLCNKDDKALPACADDEHLENGSCLSNTRSCKIKFGAGEQYWDDAKSAYGECKQKSCDKGYEKDPSSESCISKTEVGPNCSANQHEENGNCVSNIKACDVSNGSGEQTWNAAKSAYGECVVKSCESNYSVDSKNNLCVVTKTDCKAEIANAETATKTFNTDTNSYGACALEKCSGEYVIVGNSCSSKVESCDVSSFANATEGKKAWNDSNSSFGPCQITKCAQDYSVDDTNNVCRKTEVDCRAEIANAASAIKTFDTGSDNYVNCRLLSCNSSYHVKGNVCRSDIKSCTITNGSGQKTWNGRKFGPCKVKTCNQNYSIDDTNDACKLTIFDCSTEINNADSATKTFNTASDTYGSCILGSCKNGFIEDSNQCKVDETFGTLSPFYPVAPTPQKSCFNDSSQVACPSSGKDFYGQDGKHQTESFTRFKDLGDGTVFDRVLKGYWQKCEAGLSGSDCSSGSAEAKNWADAKSYCENLSLAGIDDWRLPDVYEGHGLINIEESSDPHSFRSVFPNSGSSTWSLTGYAASSASISWHIGFLNARLGTKALVDTNQVRCFHSGSQSESLSDKISVEDQGDGILIEKTSRLRLTKCPLGYLGTSCDSGSISKMNWQDALASCENLSLGGRKWRLPSRYELSFFVDYKKSAPSVFDQTLLSTWYFDNDGSSDKNLFWTASTRKADPEYAWLVSMSHGHVDWFANKKIDNANVAALCVSDPKIDDVTYARPIEVAAAIESECKVCTDWTDRFSCSQPATCPARGEDGFGQEGSVPVGVPLRFRDFGDGRLLDLNTGRQWTKCAAGASGSDCSAGVAEAKNWPDAVSYCDNLSLGGQSDWRLPHIKELLLIQDFTMVKTSNPPINKSFFENFPDGKNVWSSTEFKVSRYAGQIHTIYPTYDNPEEKREKHYLICTRGKVFSNDFLQNGDGTVSDKATNLMWQRCSAGQSETDCSGGSVILKIWRDALKYCEDLSLAGYTDWRLPSIRQFQTIVDYDKNSSSGPYLDKTVFPNIKNSFDWTSSVLSGVNVNSWRFNVNDARVSGAPVDFKRRVRCVRNAVY